MSRLPATHSRLSLGDIMLLIAFAATILAPYGRFAWMVATYVLFPLYLGVTHNPDRAKTRPPKITERIRHSILVMIAFNFVAPFLGLYSIIDWTTFGIPLGSWLLIAIGFSPHALLAAWVILLRIETRVSRGHVTAIPLGGSE